MFHVVNATCDVYQDPRDISFNMLMLSQNRRECACVFAGPTQRRLVATCCWRVLSKVAISTLCWLIGRQTCSHS